MVRWRAGDAAVPSTNAARRDGNPGSYQRLHGRIVPARRSRPRTRLQGLLSVMAVAVNLAISIVLVQRIGAVGVITRTILSYPFVLVGPQSLIIRNGLCEIAARSTHDEAAISHRQSGAGSQPVAKLA